MAFIKGKDARFKFNDKFLLHATECSLSISLDLEEIATKDTVGKEQLPGDYSYTLATSALVATPTGDQATTHSVSEILVNAALDKTLIPWEFPTATTIYSGFCYVTQADITATNGSVAGSSFSLTGSGAVAREAIV